MFSCAWGLMYAPRESWRPVEWPLRPDNLGPESVSHLGVMETVKERYLPREAPLVLREGRASSFITHLATRPPPTCAPLLSLLGWWPELVASGRQGSYQGIQTKSFNSPLGGPVVVEVSVNRSWRGLFRTAPCLIPSRPLCRLCPLYTLYTQLCVPMPYISAPTIAAPLPSPQHPSPQSKDTFRIGGLQKAWSLLASGHQDHKSSSPFLGPYLGSSLSPLPPQPVAATQRRNTHLYCPVQ